MARLRNETIFGYLRHEGCQKLEHFPVLNPLFLFGFAQMSVPSTEQEIVRLKLVKR